MVEKRLNYHIEPFKDLEDQIELKNNKEIKMNQSNKQNDN